MRPLLPGLRRNRHGLFTTYDNTSLDEAESHSLCEPLRLLAKLPMVSVFGSITRVTVPVEIYSDRSSEKYTHSISLIARFGHPRRFRPRGDRYQPDEGALRRSSNCVSKRWC